MESILRFFIDLIQPGSQLVILLVLSIGCVLAGKMVWAKRGFLLLIVLWLIYSTPFIPDFFIDRLENAYPVLTGDHIDQLLDEDTASDAEGIPIVVLGAGSTPDPRLEPTQMMSSSVAMRLIEAVRLYRILPESKIVTSASAVHGELSQAEILRQAAIRLGVDRHDISIQDDPTNTCEEAKTFVREHAEGAKVIIATAASHLPRAMHYFKSQGARPVAAPASFINKRNPDRPFKISDYFPSMSNVDNLERALKEYAGRWWGC